jgi:general secretion pathway protein K
MSRSDPRRGVVLVTVLWSIALLAALAMAASTTFRGFAGVMAVGRDRVQGDALLTAGLETAAGIVGSLGDKPLAEIRTMVTLSTGSVRARLRDEGGLIDVGKAPVEVLAALFRSVGAPQREADGIAQRVIELRKSDAPAKPAATDQPFTDIRQLGSVAGIAPEWLAAVSPLTTVFGSETVNPLTAPAGVMAALPGVDRARLVAFLETRRSFPADADRLGPILGAAQRYLEVKPHRVASVELAAVLADGYEVAAEAVIVLLPQDSQPYRVLVWKPVPSPMLR